MRKKTKVGRLQAALLNWLGIPVSLTDTDFWESWGAQHTAAGQNVNERSVLSLSAAWACTRLISETIATLPLRLYERRGLEKVPAVNHPLYPIIHSQPNTESTANTYWEASAASVLLRGNSFSRKGTYGGRIRSLTFLSPNRLTVEVVGRKVPRYHYKNLDGSEVDIPPADIFRVPGFSLDGQWGLSAIAYGTAIFGSALASSKAANRTFENGLSPTVAFYMDRILKADQREEFRTALQDITGAMHAGKSPLLEGGMKAEAIGIDPKDAQLLESREYSVEEVCRWFRVDPSLVGHGSKDSNWGTGLEQKLIGFLTFTLRPWLTRIEQAINFGLLPPGDRDKYFAQFSIEGLLRADSQARANFYSVMVNNGLMTRDECRALENMPLRGGNADVLTVQTAMAPLDSLGAQNDGDAARAALAAWLNLEGDNRDNQDSA